MGANLWIPEGMTEILRSRFLSGMIRARAFPIPLLETRISVYAQSSLADGNVSLRVREARTRPNVSYIDRHFVSEAFGARSLRTEDEGNNFTEYFVRSRVL